VTEDEDLELIFSRFDPNARAEIIRDPDTGQSLQYAFIEFTTPEQCNEAYFKMNNTLIDDRRIKVDFSQSVAKIWNKYSQRRRGSYGGILSQQRFHGNGQSHGQKQESAHIKKHTSSHNNQSSKGQTATYHQPPSHDVASKLRDRNSSDEDYERRHNHQNQEDRDRDRILGRSLYREHHNDRDRFDDIKKRQSSVSQNGPNESQAHDMKDNKNRSHDKKYDDRERKRRHKNEGRYHGDSDESSDRRNHKRHKSHKKHKKKHKHRSRSRSPS